MKNKVITSVFVGLLGCSLLVGCGNTTETVNTESAAVEDTEVTDNTNTETGISTTEEIETTEREVSENITVREEQGGYLEETHVSEDESYYRIIWGGEDYIGDDLYATFSFSSIPNIGSWTEEYTDPGVYRYIYNDQWFTVAVWGYGGIVDDMGNDISLRVLTPETIVGLIPNYTCKQETIDVKTFDDGYMTATLDFETMQGLKGTAVIVDDFNQGFRYMIQFLELDNATGTLTQDAAATVVPSNFTLEELANEYTMTKDRETVIITSDSLSTVDGTPNVNGDETISEEEVISEAGEATGTEVEEIVESSETTEETNNTEIAE
jgi:hypothetical protein